MPNVGTGAAKVEKGKNDKKPIPKCIVYFRPETSYKGEFGFDWLRVKDNGLAAEPDYESIIESGYKDGSTDYTKPEAYNALKREYKKIPFIMGFNTYCIPYLNLFSKTYSDTVNITPKPPYEAKLKVLVEIKDADVDEIKFEFNKSIFSINDKEEFSLPDKNICPLKISTTIKITCKKDITTDADGEILVYAYPKGSKSKPEAEQKAERKLAGKLLVGKNDAANRKEAKFVFVCVKTNVAGAVKTGTFTQAEQNQLRNTLYQVLVRPLIWVRKKDANGAYNDIVLDLKNDVNFKTRGKYINSNGKLNEDADGGSMFSYLRNKFKNDPKNSAYKECFPVFAIAADNYDGALGQVEGIGIKNLVLFNGRNSQVIGHEALHGFGLWHTHRERSGEPIIRQANKKYVFPHGHYDSNNATDNVMSYRNNHMITTWNWQWKIIRKNV